MRDSQPKTIYLKDYEAPRFLIDKTELRFELGDEETRVKAWLHMRRNPASQYTGKELALHGQALKPLSLALDDQPLGQGEYHFDGEILCVKTVPDQFVLASEVAIKPQENTSLEGLYQSRNMFCTQCEAEGFRKITFYLDRPDVMSVFTTTIVADKARYPVLLSNGNPVDSGNLNDGRHWVTWQDPFKKPAYLFALVAGDLCAVEDSFVTCTGRKIALRIFVEAKDRDKCDFAMAALKQAMRWDEQVYGREYDLDIFMIVAVDDFNMGAMENKGLNIFNTSAVLANPAITTDAAFQRIAGIVAHEYFHNWSGNRVTCRDWFQLSLKEGFTVFRDSEFSADRESRTVKRIEDVSTLRTLQFAEDAGPIAHPVQPASYMEISNFYTLTVYEKGAEVVRMLHCLLGPALFRQGADLYFERHDGQAVTIEDFVQAMADVSGRDFSQFLHWYRQAGTPRVTATGHYDEQAQTFSLHISQSCPPTPESEHKAPFHIPIKMGLVGQKGDLPLYLRGQEGAGQTDVVIEMTTAEQTVVFERVPEKPLPSLFRGFSAPVKFSYPYSREELVGLISRDSDGFNRWDACHQLCLGILQEQIAARVHSASLPVDAGGASKSWIPACAGMTREGAGMTREGAGMTRERPGMREEGPGMTEKGLGMTEKGPGMTEKGSGMTEVGAPPQAVQNAFCSVLADSSLAADLKAMMLSLPSEAYLSEQAEIIQVEAIHQVRQGLRHQLAQALKAEFYQAYQSHQTAEPYAPEAGQIAARSLKNLSLNYLILTGDAAALHLVSGQFAHADNMTDKYAALSALVNAGGDTARELASQALDNFYQTWRHEPLVVNLWFQVQAGCLLPGGLERVKALMEHEAFDIKNPNKVRSLIGVFCSGNAINFHRAEGAGYQFLAEQVVRLDAINPQIAARLLPPLTRWRKYPQQRATQMCEQLKHILAKPGLSPDVYEVVSKSLA